MGLITVALVKESIYEYKHIHSTDTLIKKSCDTHTHTQGLLQGVLGYAFTHIAQHKVFYTPVVKGHIPAHLQNIQGNLRVSFIITEYRTVEPLSKDPP